MTTNIEKSIIQSKSELEKIIVAYRKEGLDINEMKNKHKLWEKSRKFVRRNENSSKNHHSNVNENH